MTFDEKVWTLLNRIPSGRVSTYSEIARALGSPNSARAMGNACNRNPNAPHTPCHRVVCADGKLGGYAKGRQKKIKLLESEGIRIKSGRILNFERVLIKASELR
ncbi:MAG: MGMT family protein [Candidatus Diapherotrites archaeon]